MPVQQVELDGDSHHKTYPNDVEEDKSKPTFHEGKDSGAHKALDSKDQRSIKNKLAAYEHDEHYPPEEEDDLSNIKIKDHESKGLATDHELEKEDEETIRKMDEKKKTEHEHVKHHHHHH